VTHKQNTIKGKTRCVEVAGDDEPKFEMADFCQFAIKKDKIGMGVDKIKLVECVVFFMCIHT